MSSHFISLVSMTNDTISLFFILICIAKTADFILRQLQLKESFYNFDLYLLNHVVQIVRGKSTTTK